jgi:phosphoribosylformimino-5-aminoimidazole carboxamide ribotide isomerase
MALTIIPSIDLRGGKVVRLRQGDYAQQLNYAVDPLETARAFAAAGAQWIHVVDLDGAKEGKVVQDELLAKIAAAVKVPIEVGGGVRSTEDVQRLLAAGAGRVVVGTKALEDWAWFGELAHRAEYAQKLVLAVDAKGGMVATRGWTHTTGKSAVDLAREVSDWPLAALLYTDVAKDGMMTGPNYENTTKLVQAGRVPVIASGGVGNVDHLRQVKRTGCWGCIVGRALYEGTVKLEEALAIARG